MIRAVRYSEGGGGRAQAVVGAAQQKKKKKKSKRRCQRAHLRRRFSVSARRMTATHGVVCVRVGMCQVCVSQEVDGSGEGVNIRREDLGGVLRACRRRSDVPAVVQEMGGQHGDEDVLPVHGEEQGSGAVGTRS